VADVNQAEILGRFGSSLAREHDGGVLALHVVNVPPQLNLSDGRVFLKRGRPPLQKVIDQAKLQEVPVHTMIRLGRNVSDAIIKTAAENTSDMILFGWPGRSGTNERLFGSVIDRLIENPPADIAIVRYRPYETLNRIIVPIAGGRNSRLAANVAISIARNTGGKPEVVLLHVVVPGVDPIQAEGRAKSAFRRSTHGLDYPFSEEMITADSPYEGIIKAAEDSDMIVIGATKEPRFKNLLMGNVAQRVAEGASCPVIIVKRRSTIIDAMLRETVLMPIRQSDKLAEEEEVTSKAGSSAAG
jgi:nucleotide-binding universal stress UspA family protein